MGGRDIVKNGMEHAFNWHKCLALQSLPFKCSMGNNVSGHYLVIIFFFFSCFPPCFLFLLIQCWPKKKHHSIFANISTKEDWIFIKFKTLAQDRQEDHQRNFDKDLCTYARIFSKNIRAFNKTSTHAFMLCVHMFLHKTIQKLN